MDLDWHALRNYQLFFRCDAEFTFSFEQFGCLVITKHHLVFLAWAWCQSTAFGRFSLIDLVVCYSNLRRLISYLLLLVLNLKFAAMQVALWLHVWCQFQTWAQLWKRSNEKRQGWTLTLDFTLLLFNLMGGDRFVADFHHDNAWLLLVWLGHLNVFTRFLSHFLTVSYLSLIV